MRARALALFVLSLGLVFSSADAAEERREIVLAATDNGRPAHEILTEAFRRAGYSVKIRFMPWVRCLADAKAGVIDGVFGATRTPRRESEFLFTDEVLWQEVQAAFARADDRGDYRPTVDGLADARVGLMNGSATGAEFDQAIAGKRLRHVEFATSFDSLLLMLTGQRVDVIIADRWSVMGVARQHGVLDKVREVTPPVLDDPVYVAFTRARDMSGVSRDFSAALRAMKQDGSYGEIFARQSR